VAQSGSTDPPDEPPPDVAPDTPPELDARIPLVPPDPAELSVPLVLPDVTPGLPLLDVL